MNKLLYSSYLLKAKWEQFETILVADWNNSGNLEKTFFILPRRKLASNYTCIKQLPSTECKHLKIRTFVCMAAHQDQVFSNLA